MVMFCAAGVCAHIVMAATAVAAASKLENVKVRMVPDTLIRAPEEVYQHRHLCHGSVQQERAPAIHERRDIVHQSLLDHPRIVARLERIDHFTIADE